MFFNVNNECIRQEIQGFSEQIFAFGAEGKGGPPPCLRRKSKKISEKLERAARAQSRPVKAELAELSDDLWQGTCHPIPERRISSVRGGVLQDQTNKLIIHVFIIFSSLYPLLASASADLSATSEETLSAIPPYINETQQAQKINKFQLMAPVNNAISIDIAMSPYAGGENLLFLGRSLEKGETYFLSDNPSIYSNSSYARFWRLSELIAVWLPLNYFSMLLQHEVFGHGYRLRDLLFHNLAKVKGYQFSWPPPYGPGGASTSFYISRKFTSTDESAVASAGVEATAILALLTKEKWLESKTIDPRQTVLYLLCQHDLALYIGSLKEKSNLDINGHDIRDYITAVNFTYPDALLTVRQLRALSWINWADPFTFYAFYSWFHYLSSGKETPLPMIASCYLPGFRLGLTPFGPQIYSEHFILRDKTPFYAYFAAGRHSDNTYIGTGMYAPRLWHVENCSFGFRMDAWLQPTLLLKPGAVPFISLDLDAKPSEQPLLYPSSKQHATHFGGAISAILSYKLSSISSYDVEIGYKSAGFLPGYSLYPFPTARFNCLIQF